MDELVRTLSKGSHPVKLVLRPEQNIERLREFCNAITCTSNLPKPAAARSLG